MRNPNGPSIEEAECMREELEDKKTKPKKVIRLDASALVNCGGCILKLWLTTVEGWRGPKLSISTEYGSAFHIFKETMRQKHSMELGIHAAQNYFKSKLPDMDIPKDKLWLNIGHLNKTCQDYEERFGTNGEKDDFETLVKDDGTLALEQTFSIPLYEDDNFIIMLCGTIDDQGKFKHGGCYGIADEKTTSEWDRNKFFAKFDLSPQLLTYTYAVKWYGERWPDSIYGKMCKAGRIGTFINGVFLKKDAPSEFVRSKVMYFRDEQLAEFEAGLKDLVNQLVQRLIFYPLRPYKQGLSTGKCLGDYGRMCEFAGPCNAPDDQSMFAVLKNYYKQKEYNPLDFRKQT